MKTTVLVPKRYDWVACGIAAAVALAATVPAALAVTLVADSTLLLSTVATAVGTGVGRWTYARVAKRGSRPIEDESCG
jgi:hypothetical protein